MLYLGTVEMGFRLTPELEIVENTVSLLVLALFRMSMLGNGVKLTFESGFSGCIVF